MDEDKIRQIAQNVVDSNSNRNQFNVTSIGFHHHTGQDAPNVNFPDLRQKYMILPYTIFGTNAATATNYSVFFTAPSAMTILGITEVHTTAGSDGSAVTLTVEKLTGTTAPGSGTDLLSANFNLKGTANTVQTGTLSSTVGVVQLAAGNRLALKKSGTLTAVANVTITLTIGF